MSKKSAGEWQSILHILGVREATARKWAPAFEELVHEGAFSLGWDEIDDFVAQIIHESAYLEHVRENLNYRAETMMRVWPNRFRTLEQAAPYAGKPALLAARVYDNRKDLGNDEPGDGLKYIGRSPIMVTGKANHELVQAEIGEPVVDKPELLETPRVGLKASIAWWERRIPDEIVGNPDLVSRRVNGGKTGLEERIRLARLSDQVIS